MIQANELRIGNYAKDEKTGAILRVSTIGDNVIYDVVDRSLYPLPNGWQAVPIPLTPEILEKACGFVKSSEFDVWNGLNHHLSIEYAYGGYRWYIDDVGNNEGSHPRKIKYLHQLQNLYFALTGQELTITP